MSIPSIPLSLAVPAAAASIAYLNARCSIFYDYRLIKGFANLNIGNITRERRNRSNIFYDLENHAQSKKTADKEFLVYEGRSWTFRQTYDTVLKYAAWLRNEHRVQAKEIVAIDFMNSPEMIFVWLALWSLGAIPAFINYNLTGKPLSHCVKVSTARLMIVDGEVRSQVTPELLEEFSSSEFRSGKGPVETVFYDGVVESQILQMDGLRVSDSERGHVAFTDMAALIFTSGTTGLPKPAVVSWAKAATGLFVAEWLVLKKSDRFYTPMPLYHSSASLLGFLTCLIFGCTVIVGHRFSTRKFWEEVRSSNATVIQYVGETLRYLLAAPPQIDPKTGENLDKKNSVRIAFGNGLRPDVWNKFKERFGVGTIGEFYAATEGTSASWNLSSNDFSAGAIGRNGSISALILGSRIAVVQHDYDTETVWRDPKTGLCRKVPRGEPGELLYQIDPEDISYHFQGYFNNPKATDGKVLRNVLKKGDAWFRTGDLIRWDNQGRWYFSDRIGDTFRWKSENVSTSEVAEVLGSHPSVTEANVYGVAIPHHDGRAGCAATVLSNAEPTSQDLNGLAHHVQKNLPRYAHPLFLRVTKTVQATGNNKQHISVDPATKSTFGAGSVTEKASLLGNSPLDEFAPQPKSRSAAPPPTRSSFVHATKQPQNTASDVAIARGSPDIKQLFDTIETMQKIMTQMMQTLADVQQEIKDDKRERGAAVSSSNGEGFEILSTAFKELGAKSAEIERLKRENEALTRDNSALRERIVRSETQAKSPRNIDTDVGTGTTSTRIPIHPIAEDEDNDIIQTIEAQGSPAKRARLSESAIITAAGTAPRRGRPPGKTPRARRASVSTTFIPERSESPPSHRGRTRSRIRKQHDGTSRQDLEMTDASRYNEVTNANTENTGIRAEAVTDLPATHTPLNDFRLQAQFETHPVSAPVARTQAVPTTFTPTSASAGNTRQKRKAQIAARDLLAQQAMAREEYLASDL